MVRKLIYLIILLFAIVRVNAQTKDPGKWSIVAKYKSFWSQSKIQEDYKNKQLGVIITCDPIKKTITFIQADTVILKYGLIETSEDDDRYDKDCYVYHTLGLGDVIYYPKQKKVVRNYPNNFIIKFLSTKEK
jgi:hypothetical protein